MSSNPENVAILYDTTATTDISPSSDPYLPVAVFSEIPALAIFEILDPGQGEFVNPDPVVVRGDPGPPGDPGLPGDPGQDGTLQLANGQTPEAGAVVIYDGAEIVATPTMNGGFF